MAIYKVGIRVGDVNQTRLIDAANESQVAKHIIKQHCTIEAVRTAEQIKAVADIAAAGVKVETATAE